MNNQEYLNRTHEAHATGHSIAPGSYDRKSLNPAYAEHMYGEPGSAIPGHAASGVNPKRHIPRTLHNESGSVPSDLSSRSTTHPDSRFSGSDTTGHGVHGVHGVNHNTQSHYTHGDTIPGSHVSDVSSNSNQYGNATQIAPGSNVHHTGAPGTGGVAGSAMANAPDSLGHNNAHPQFWKADDVPVGDNAHHTTHAGSAIPGALGAGAAAAAANAHNGTQHGHRNTFSRKPVAQTEYTNVARSGYDSAGVSPNDNLYRSDTVSTPSENSGHSGVLGSGVSGSSGHSLTHYNHGLQYSVADSTVPGSGPNAVHPDQGNTHVPAVKYHGTVADRPVELDDPSSPVNNVGNHHGTFGRGDATHPNFQNQAVGANHPGNQAGSYGDGAASHAHFQDNAAHPGVNTGNVHDNIHPNANTSNIHDNTIHPNANASNIHNTQHTTHGGLNDTGAVHHDTTHTTHGGLNETGALHHDNSNNHTLGSGHTTTTDSSIGSHTTAHNGAPTHDPTANKVPSAAAGARFGEKLKGFAAQGHGLGEFLRGNANAAIDTALGDKKNMAKHEATARKGEEEIKRGELANKAKSGIRH